MLDDVIAYLRCPQCADGSGASRLGRDGAVLRCAAGHSFDIARSGYVSLLPGGAGKNSGDTAAMVKARCEFLAGGHYAGLAGALAQAAAGAAGPGPGCVIDVGAGTGYFLAAVLDRLPPMTGLALDLSKSALKVAARCHPRAVAIGCDAWRRLPVADGAAEVVLNLFAPRAGAELRRVLSPAGRLIIGTPSPDHLAELVEPLGLLRVDEHKQARLTTAIGQDFDLVSSHEHRETGWLDHRAALALAAMGPGAWHAGPGRLAARAARLSERTPVTIAVRISAYRRS